MSRPYDLIAFDWDGTLFDSTGIIVRCIQEAVVDVGGQRPSDEQAAYVIGMALGPALAHAAPDVPPAQYKALGLRYRHHYAQHMHDIFLFDGVIPMLQDLKAQGVLLAVATGKSRQGLNEALGHVQLQGLFDDSRTADETAGKPDPLMLHELMASWGIPPERTLMVGDTTHDLEMACRAGCASVGVSYGAHAHYTFDQWQPRWVAHSVAELHEGLVNHG